MKTEKMSGRLADFWGREVTMPDTVVTEAADASCEDALMVQEAADRCGMRYLPRRGRPLVKVFAAHDLQYVIVWPRSGALCVYRRGYEKPFVYHPGISLVRVKSIRSGQTDKLVRIARVQAGDRILDCTAGLCSDAAVLSYAAGCKGECTALEANPQVAFVVRQGLRSYASRIADFDHALQRIQLCCTRWQDVLPRLPDQSYDVVYMDPMFEHGIARSPSMATLRPFAEQDVLTLRDLHEARRVARRGVVIKARRHSAWLRTLDPAAVDAGQGSTSYAFLPADCAVMDAGQEGRNATS